MNEIVILSYAFSVWMFVDALRRKAEFYWFLVILFVPLGAFIYFLFVKIQDPVAEPSSTDSGGPTMMPQRLSRQPSLETLRVAVEETPSIENQLRLASALFQARKSEESAAIYEQCLAIDAEDAEALYGLGRCRVETKRWPEGVNLFTRAIAQDRSFRDYDVWLDLAFCYIQNEEGAKAIEILERLVEEAPRVKHKTILGRCLAELGHPQKARDMLQQAVADYEESSFFLQRDNESWVTQARQMLETIPVQLN